MESKAALQNRITVAVRVRPHFIKRDSCCVTCEKDSLEIVNHRNYTQNIKYKFTTVFDADSTQNDVYKTFVAPKLDCIFNGENMSILAYGATGTGKTYTMIGTSDNPGIVPQSLRHLFQSIEAASNEQHTYNIKLSFLEIYNEKVVDLLTERKSELQIWEDVRKNIVIPGLRVKEIDSYEEFESVFLPAMSQRITVSSNLNSHSSRSHTILMVIVEKTEVFSPFRTRIGKIQFVDLAGSENNKLSGNKGLRMRESTCINKSLFVLHEVVDAIRSGQKRIPYRDSKLTRLLQDSFGGRSFSLLLATIAPEESCYFSTYCTLNFATKSKKIVNNPVACEQHEEGCQSSSVNVNNLQLDVAKKPISPSDISVGNACAATVVSPTEVEFELARDLLKNIKERTKILKTAMEKENHSEKNKGMTGERYISNIANIPDKICKPAEDSGTPLLYRSASSSRVTFDMKKQSHTVKQMSSNILVRNAGILKNIENSTPLQPLSTIPYKCHSETRKRQYTEMDLVFGDSSKDDEILIKHRHKTHKNHILYLLNSQNKADILLLHTVGTRRSDLIYNWQQKHGPFKKVEDLYQIPGLGEKYVSTFMHRNFLLYDDKENEDSIGISLL